MTAVADRIVERVEDYFRRQIAWFENLLHELESIETKLQAATLKDLADRAARQEETTRAFAEEFTAIQAEWSQARNVSEADRARVGALAQRASTLAEQLQECYRRGAGAARARASEMQHEMAELRKGRMNMRKFRPTGDADSTTIDRDA